MIFFQRLLVKPYHAGRLSRLFSCLNGGKSAICPITGTIYRKSGKYISGKKEWRKWPLWIEIQG